MSRRMRSWRALSMPAVHSRFTAPGMCPPWPRGLSRRSIPAVATGVPDAEVGSAETALQAFAGGGGFFMQRQADWPPALAGTSVDTVLFFQPRQQAAVEAVVFCGR